MSDNRRRTARALADLAARQKQAATNQSEPEALRRAEAVAEVLDKGAKLVEQTSRPRASRADGVDEATRAIRATMRDEALKSIHNIAQILADSEKAAHPEAVMDWLAVGILVGTLDAGEREAFDLMPDVVIQAAADRAANPSPSARLEQRENHLCTAEELVRILAGLTESAAPPAGLSATGPFDGWPPARIATHLLTILAELRAEGPALEKAYKAAECRRELDRGQGEVDRQIVERWQTLRLSGLSASECDEVVGRESGRAPRTIREARKRHRRR